MRKNVIIKALILGSIGCTFTITGMAANGHGQGIADSTTEVNEAKHEAVGVGMKDSKETHTQHHAVGSPPRTDLHTVTSKNSKSTEINKLYIETLQPITHYDENAKSVVFVQGRIGRSGEKISSYKLEGYLEPARPAGTFISHDKQTDTKESLGMNANIGIGYRRLSKGEHAYVGVNAFYDHVFKGGYKRVSGGLEYVVGLNEFHANIYKNLGSNERKYTGLHGRTSTWYDPTGLYPYGRDDDTSLYNYAKVDYENHWILSENTVARGYDIGYARTFKNARWARVYADYYNWRGREAVRVGYEKLNKRDAIKGFKVGAELHITPHLTLDAGYKTASHHLSGPYATLKYTIGTSKFAWRGGKHSENAITTARAKMLDKVHRSDMVVQEIMEENYDHGVTDVGL